MVDLGRPWAIWHALIYWNPRSVMFEVAWCVMLYTTVLALEFSPVVLERFKLKRALKVIKAITIPLVVAGRDSLNACTNHRLDRCSLSSRAGCIRSGTRTSFHFCSSSRALPQDCA